VSVLAAVLPSATSVSSRDSQTTVSRVTVLPSVSPRVSQSVVSTVTVLLAAAPVHPVITSPGKDDKYNLRTKQTVTAAPNIDKVILSTRVLLHFYNVLNVI